MLVGDASANDSGRRDNLHGDDGIGKVMMVTVAMTVRCCDALAARTSRPWRSSVQPSWTTTPMLLLLLPIWSVAARALSASVATTIVTATLSVA
jgi:hypothetical protein